MTHATIYASLQTLAHVSRGLRDNDDVVLRLLRLADAFDTDTTSLTNALNAQQALQNLVAEIPELAPLLDMKGTDQA